MFTPGLLHVAKELSQGQNMSFLRPLKSWLKRTWVWTLVRRSAKGVIHALPLSVCRAIKDMPWVGLIASARLMAHAPCAAWFSGVPGKQVDLVPGLNAQQAKAVARARALLPYAPEGSCSILGQCHVVKGQNADFSGARVAVVAHWDPDKKIDPFVDYYLTHLQQAGFRTILTSSAPLEAAAEDMAHADAVMFRMCDGYDFTSWKGALECFPSLRCASELVFTNDSIFAPLADIGNVHAVMDTVSCDFWGLLESRDQLPAMPSFYMCFKEKALKHPCFTEFWDSVDTTSDKDVVVQKFEQSQALWFALHGLVPGAYIHWDMMPWLKGGPAYACWKQLVQLFGVPCIKRAIVNGDVWWSDISGWRDMVAQSGYPVELIDRFLARYRKAHARKLQAD